MGLTYDIEFSQIKECTMKVTILQIKKVISQLEVSKSICQSRDVQTWRENEYRDTINRYNRAITSLKESIDSASIDIDTTIPCLISFNIEWDIK